MLFKMKLNPSIYALLDVDNMWFSVIFKSLCT